VVKAVTNLSNANACNFHYSHDNQTFDCFDRKLNGKYLKEIFPINLIKPLGQMNEIIIYYRPQSNNEKRGIYLIINNEYIKQGFFIGEKMKYSIYTRVVGMTADFYGK